MYLARIDENGRDDAFVKFRYEKRPRELVLQILMKKAHIAKLEAHPLPRAAHAVVAAQIFDELEQIALHHAPKRHAAVGDVFVAQLAHEGRQIVLLVALAVPPRKDLLRASYAERVKPRR